MSEPSIVPSLPRRQLLSPCAHTSLPSPLLSPLSHGSRVRTPLPLRRQVGPDTDARQSKLIRPRADSTSPPFLIRHPNRRPSMTPAFRRNKSMSAGYAHPLPNPQSRSSTTTSLSTISSCTCPSFRTGAPSTSPWSIKPASTFTHYLL